MDVYSLRILSHNGAGNFMENVLHYNVDDGGLSNPYDVAKALCDQWSTANMASWQSASASDVTIDYVYAKRVSGLGGPTAVKPISLNGVEGSSSLSAGPAVDLALLSMDPSNRPGHIYLGAVPMDGCAADVITLAYGTIIAALGTALAVPLAGGVIVSANQCVYNRKLGEGYNVTHWIMREKLTMLNKRTTPII